MLRKLYGKNLKRENHVNNKKSFETDKADIIININNTKKYISIKSGKNNSIHLEPLEDFNTFLRENNISEKLTIYQI